MSKETKHPLHELLAVLADLEGTAKKIRDEAITTFTKKGNHFNGYTKSLAMYDEDRRKEELGAADHRELVTTVDKKLSYIQKSQAKYWDAILQQESTNQKAVANLVVNGETIAENLPATFLLGMESRLKALRAVFEAIPTLDPSIKWEEDLDLGVGVHKSAVPETSYKQEKTVEHKVIVPATKEHPAQVREWAVNRNVGTFTLIHRSSCVSPAAKSEYLDRIDTLIQATKKARQRANSTEIERRSLGNKLFEYILKG